jgi:hypothetical protein
MQRAHDWPRRLHLLVESSQAVVFTWGQYDCGQFVARWIREATGVDVAAALRGTYSDEISAEKIFLNGFANLGAYAASIAAAHAMPEIIPVTFARRGDIVWVDNGTPLNPSPYGALGVVGLDPRFAVCMSEQGTRRVHMHRWKRAWRVGS